MTRISIRTSLTNLSCGLKFGLHGDCFWMLIKFGSSLIKDEVHVTDSRAQILIFFV